MSAITAVQGVSAVRENPEMVFAGVSLLLVCVYLAVEYFKGGVVAKSDLFGRYASALFLIIVITTLFLKDTKGQNTSAMMVAMLVMLGVFCLLFTLCF
jgi:hypothetical protein